MVYEIADLRIEIRCRYPFTAWLCREYLSKDQSAPASLSVSVSNEEMDAERAVAPELDDASLESNCIYRKLCVQLPAYNRFLLHASVVEYGGVAYAFLGKSGAGKSTHAGLWIKYLQEASILNGDKPIVRVEESGIIVYGTPWCGKELLGKNASAPLKSICFIEQEKENSIVALSQSAAAKRVLTQTIFPKEETLAARTLELLNELITRTPAYLLKCNVSEEAFKTSYKALTE